MSQNINTPVVKKVFVLMLENRSFDHMLGFSGLDGTDAITGKPRSINGLQPGKYFNRDSSGNLLYASTGAAYDLKEDPGHEFNDVVEQLCGAGAAVDPLTGRYPRVTNSAFVLNYLRQHPSTSPVPVMQCFEATRLPVLESLAKEFAVCDAWYSPVPGATWPNRFFIHAASSAGMVESPDWSALTSTFFLGYSFQHGTIFDLLDASNIDWCVYEGDAFPQAFAIRGMTWQWIRNHRFRDFVHFENDIKSADFKPQYVFIEPNYGRDILPPMDFMGGNSQHPIDNVLRGELLIKKVYESIRQSPHWESSVLVITYDEHGGFYDHVPPPTGATPPGDAANVSRQPEFDFKQYGVRVPTLVISPFTARNIIDGTLYDHASFLRTLELLFDLPTLTDRDRNAADFIHLLRSVKDPRVGGPSPTVPPSHGINQMKSPGPDATQSGPEFRAPLNLVAKEVRPDRRGEDIHATSEATANDPLKRHHYGWLHVAFLRDLAIRQHKRMSTLALDDLRREVAYIRTQGEARHYMNEVRAKVAAFKSENNL